MALRKIQKTSRNSPSSKDAIALLKADHAAVTELFAKYEAAKREDQKNSIAQKICNELKVHATIEEEIFYPELRAAKQDQDVDSMLNEADVEHDGAKKLIAEIEASDASDDMFDAQIKVLSEYIKHHVKEEQSEIFPEARSAGLDLKEMGMRLAKRKMELKAER